VEKLRHAWLAKGNRRCTHQHLAIEKSEFGYATGFYACKECGTRTPDRSISMKRQVPAHRRSRLRLTVTFLGGAMIGGTLALLNTPETGIAVRRRLSRSVKILRTQLPVLMTEAREEYGARAKDARQAFRQTGSRLALVLRAWLNAITKGKTNR
jgi:gas vesicle protein